MSRTLAEALTALDRLAPLRGAASWDNVGLLLEGDRPIRRAVVTIDLTAGVLAEALDADVDLVIAYHPPLFRPIKALRRSDPTGRALIGLARRGVHLYSPHTALDVVPGGINDWLLEAFGEVDEVRPITPDPVDSRGGEGRIARLGVPRSLGELTEAIKAFLGLASVRVSGDPGATIRTVAVCPGAGGSLFEGLRDVDLLLTGELRHHDVLGFAARGAACVLTEHTNTERGYLPRYARHLTEALGIEVRVAASDADPLTLR